MSSIDDRIVNMHFDNAKFEKGVAESINSIENLKVSLKNIDNTSISFDKLQNAANGLKLDSIAASADKIAGRFDAMGIIGTTAIAKMTSGVMDFVTNSLGKAASKAKEVWDAISGGGMERAQNIEKAKFTVEGLGASFDKLKDSIDASVQDTAYGFDEAAMAASQFLATGVKEGDEMTRSLTSISGLAAMTGSSYGEIARIMTTVAGNGRVMGQQLNEIGARGINAAAALTKYFNDSSERLEHWRDVYNVTKAKTKEPIGEGVKLTEQNVRDMVSQGVIDFSTFSDAMYESFGAHAKEAQRTFTGASANVTAALKRIGADFQSITISSQDYVDTLDKAGKVDFTKSTFNQINVLNELRNVLKGLQTELNNAGFVKMFGDIYHTISKGMTFFLHGFLDPLNTASNVLAPELIQSLRNIKDAISNVFNFVVGIASSISNAWKAIFPESLNQTILNITKGIKDFTSMLPQIGDANKALSNIFGLPDISSLMGDNAKATEEAGNQITETAEEVAEAYDGVTGSLRELTAQVINGDYGNGQDRIDALGDSYQQIQDAVNSCYDAEGNLHEDWIDNIDETIQVGQQLNDTIAQTSAEEAVSEADTKYEEFKETLEETVPVAGELGLEFEGLRVIFQGVFSMLDLGRKAIGGIVEIGRRFFLPVVGRIAQVVMEVVATIASWITALNSVTPSQEQFNGALDFLSNLLKPLWNGFHALTSGIIDFLKALRPGGDPIGYFLGSLSSLVKFITGIEVDLKSIPGKIGNHLANLFDKIGSVKTPSGGYLKDAVANFFSPVIGYFDSFPKSLNGRLSAISQMFSDMGIRFGEAIQLNNASLLDRVKYFFDPALKFLSGIRDRLASIFAPVINYLSPIATSLKELLKRIIKPIQDFVSDIRQALSSGEDPLSIVKSRFQPIIDFLGPFGSGLAKIFDGILQTSKSFIDGLVKSIDAAGGNPFAALIKGLDNARQNIKSLLAGFAKNDFVSAIKDIFKNVTDILKDGIETVKKFISDAFNELVKFVTGFFSKGKSTQNIAENVSGEDRAFGLTEVGSKLSSVADAIAIPGSAILSFLDKFGQGLKEYVPLIVSNLSILLVALSAFKISKAVQTIADAIKSAMAVPAKLAGLLGEISVSLRNFRKSIDFAIVAEGIKSIAVSIAILAASLIILGSIDPNVLSQGAKALGGIAAGLAALAAVFGIFVKKLDFMAVGKGFLMVATGCLLFVVSLNMLMRMLNQQQVDANGNVVDANAGLHRLLAALGVMVGLIVSVSLILAVANRIAGRFGRFTNLGSELTGLAAGVAIMAWSLRSLYKLFEQIDKDGEEGKSRIMAAIAAILGLEAMLALLSVALHMCGVNSMKAGVSALLMSIGIAILAGAMAMLSALPVDLQRGRDALASITLDLIAIVGVFSLLERINPKANIEHIGKSILMIAGGVAVLAAAMIILGSVPTDNLQQGAAALLSIAVGLGVLSAIAAFAKSNMLVGAGAILMIAAAIFVLVGALYAITQIQGDLIGALAVMGALAAGLIVLGVISGRLGKPMLEGSAAVLILSVAILALSAALYLLSSAMGPQMLGAVIMLGVLVAVLVVLGAVASGISVGIYAIVAAMLSLAALALAIGIGAVLIAAAINLMVDAFERLGKVAQDADSVNAIINVIQQLAGQAGNLMLIGVAMVVIGVGALAAGAGMMLFGLGVILLAAGVALGAMALNLFVDALSKLVEFVNTGAMQAIVDNFANFAGLAGIFALMGVALIVFGAGALVAGAGILVLGLGMMVLAAGAALGALALNLVVDALTRLGEFASGDGFKAIIENFGGFVALAALFIILSVAIIAVGLAAIVLGAGAAIAGAGLVIFGAGAMIAAAGIMMLGAAVASALTVISAAIVAFAQAGYYLMVGLAQGLADGASILFNTLGSIVTGAIDFVKGLLGINSPSVVFGMIGKFCMQGLGLGIAEDGSKPKEALKGVTADMVSQAQGVAPEFKNIGSEYSQNLGDGASNMPSTMSKIFDKIKGVTTSEGQAAGEQGGEATTDGFMSGISQLSPEVREQMKSLGFDIEQFAGGDLSNIAKMSFGNVGEAASQGMAEKIAQNSESADEARIQVDAIADAAQAEVDARFPEIGINAMAKINEGFMNADLGTTLLEGMTVSMESANQIGVELANSIKTGFESVPLTEAATAKVNEFVMVFSTALEIGSTVGTQFANTVKQGLEGVNFTVSGSMAGMQYIAGITATMQGGFAIGFAFANSVKLGASSVSMSSAGTSLGQQFISGLTSYMGMAFTVGWNLGTTAKAGAESVNMSSAGIQNATEFCTGLASFIGMALFSGLMLGNSARSGAESVDMTSSGSQNASEFCRGISSMLGAAFSAGSSLGYSAVDGARSSSGGMYGIGANIGFGFVNGIRSQIYAAAAAGAALGNAAKSAAQAAVQVASPSKVFLKIGQYVGMGFVIGISDYLEAAGDAGGAIGDAAIDAVNETVDKMVDILGSDLDAAPTIRPVLDDSELRRGLHSLNKTMDDYGMGGSYAMGIADRMAGTSSFGSGYSESGLAKAIASELIKSEAVGNGDTSITFNAYGVDSPQQFSRETMHKVSQIQRAR